MRTLLILMVSAVIFFGNTYAWAGNADVPGVVSSGLEAYAAKGSVAAVEEWITGGPIDRTNAMSLVKAFRQIEDVYGKYKGYDLIAAEKITVHSKIVYIQLNYEKGPAFARFFCYKQGNKWIITEKLEVNTIFNQVVPGRVL